MTRHQQILDSLARARENLLYVAQCGEQSVAKASSTLQRYEEGKVWRQTPSDVVRARESLKSKQHWARVHNEQAEHKFQMLEWKLHAYFDD